VRLGLLCAVEEAQQQPMRLVGTLDLWHMTAVLERDLFGAR